MYCTPGIVASRNSNAAVVSATSSPLMRTCTRPLVGSMVIGCPALGSKTSRWLMMNAVLKRRCWLQHQPAFNASRRRLFRLRGRTVLLRRAHRVPEPGGLADRFLDRAGVPAQLALRLAAVDVGFTAHHPHRRKAELGVLAGEPRLQAARRGHGIEHR